jgi:small conductance mechanosensitive channel
VAFLLAEITANELAGACGPDPDWLCRWTYERTQSRALADVADFIIGTPLAIILIALGALLANHFVGRAIERALRGVASGVVRERVGAARRRGAGRLLPPSDASLRADQRISALTSVLRSVAGFVILLFATFAVLSEVGVDVAPLLAGAGVVGVALGFGSQSLVKDFLSGMFILVEDQFGVGDFVELDGTTSGTVEAVSLRTTRLRSEDGTIWHVPNGAIIRVGNKSQGSPRVVAAEGDEASDEASEADQAAAKVQAAAAAEVAAAPRGGVAPRAEAPGRRDEPQPPGAGAPARPDEPKLPGQGAPARRDEPKPPGAGAPARRDEPDPRGPA